MLLLHLLSQQPFTVLSVIGNHLKPLLQLQHICTSVTFKSN